MKRGIPLPFSLAILALSACTLVEQNIAVKSGELAGSLQDNVYTSPTRSFKVRLPRLARDGVEIRDERISENSTRLTIKDDLCREFIVSQRPGYLGSQSLQEWVEEHIVQPLKKDGFDIQPVKPLRTSQGEAIFLRYRVPAGAPCAGTGTKDGKTKASRPDADVGWYVYHRDGAVYRVVYVLGLVEAKPAGWVDAFLVKREPVDEVLAAFAEGFEITAGRSP